MFKMKKSFIEFHFIFCHTLLCFKQNDIAYSSNEHNFLRHLKKNDESKTNNPN